MLDDGDKVRVIIKFAGRQIRHLEIGDDLFNKVLAQLPGVLLESRSGLEGKKISITISNMENKKLE
jgi:translation initiation factor IF-3